MKLLKISEVFICLWCMSSCIDRGDMPSFAIRLRDSTTILTSDKIPTGQPVMLIFFDPDCEHCQKETEELLNNINVLRNVQIYFITVEAFDRMKVFHKYYHLANYPNIIVGRDFNFELLKKNDLPTTPCTLLYNKHKKLKAIWKGYFPIKKIVEEVNNL